jgi:hypothetical protein
MSKLKVLIATLTVVMLFLLPTVALAQPDVCGFYGSVTLDGDAVENGTVVKAWIDNVEVESTTTTGSAYNMAINGEGQTFSGKTVVFTVGADDDPVGESSTYEKGANKALDLTAATLITVDGDPTITLAPDEGAATNVCGENFAPNNSVYIYFDGELYKTITADANGEFCEGVIPTVSEAGEYTIAAQDVLDRSAQETFTLAAATSGSGDPGDSGKDGVDGVDGKDGVDGEDGDDGGSTMGIVAIILAVIAIILAIVFRVMKPAGAAPEA